MISNVLLAVILFAFSCQIATAQERPDVTRGNLIKQVNPNCSKGTSCYGFKGTVKLKLLIEKNGTVKTVTIVDGDSHLIDPVVEAVKQWTYSPYMLHGKPVAAYRTVNVDVH